MPSTQTTITRQVGLKGERFSFLEHLELEKKRTIDGSRVAKAKVLE